MRRPPYLFSLKVVAWLGLLTLGALTVFFSACRPDRSPRWTRLDSRIQESSGLVASHEHRGVFWAHGDSDCPNEIYAVDGNGRLLSRHQLDVPNIDWEDIAIDDQGNLYLGDIGNNFSERRDLVVYRMREPDPELKQGSLTVDTRIPFRYPDQTRFDRTRSNFDAESLAWYQGSLYLFSKHRRDDRTTLYRFPSLEGGEEVVLEKVSEYTLGGMAPYGGMATAADIRADGRYLALLSYHALFIFELPSDGSHDGSQDLFANPVKTIELRAFVTRQCEAVVWDGDSILLSNEGGRLLRIAEPLSPSLTVFPE